MKILCSTVKVVLILIMSVVIAACGSKKEKSNMVELEFFQQKVETVDIFNDIISKFEEENPGIKIIQNNIPDSRNILMTRMASGDVPDIMTVWPNAIEFRVQVEEGYFLDLSEQRFLNNVRPEFLENIKVAGKSYSLPISLNTVGVYYNPKIFNKFGLSIPETYGELIAAAKKLKQAGITPFALGDKDSWTIGIVANAMIGSEMGKEKADKFFKDLSAGKTSAVKNERLTEMADRILEMRKYGPEDSLALGYMEAIHMFATERSAMFINGIWAIPSIEKANPNLEFDMFPLPASKKEDTKVIYGIDMSASISKDTEHPEEALKFLEFLSRPEIAEIYSNRNNSPSTIKGVEVKSDKIKRLTAILFEGRAFEWLHFKWEAGLENQWNNAVQTLVVTGDKQGYLKELDKSFLKRK